MTSSHHWHEYEVGLVGDVARDVNRTLSPLALGLLAAFALVLAAGLAEEEGLVFDLAYDLGMGGQASSALADAVGFVARMSLGVLLVLGYLVGFCICLSLSLRDLATSRALVRAARGGAPRDAVPNPMQVESVVNDSVGALRAFLYLTVAVAGLVALTLGGYALVEGWGEGMLVALVCALCTITVIGVLRHISRVVVPDHQRRRREIAAHWTTADEEAAWARANGVAGPHHSRKNSSTGRDVRVRIGSVITVVAGIGTGAAYLLLNGLIIITHPHAQRWSGGDAGPRVQLDPAAERLVDIGTWTFGALIVAVLIAAAIGNVVEGAGHAAERRALHAALDDPQADRPAAAILAEYAERRSVRLAQVLSALAGIGLALGPAAAILSTFEVDSFTGATALFGNLRTPALLITGGSVVMVFVAFWWNSTSNRRGRALRNRIMARWPVLPRQSKDSEGRVHPARRGPALSAGRGAGEPAP
ncbi:hypothetical protein [Ruania halotolerans]|uniref:hypothetical protein n=1 Tax=Ruania halotolerans TaxID=2897773 RepID=UPI001E414C3A|nr:hypothetical protein [Ruania halotolerans]UFU07400.1 hypothetical protein LQF10_04615 [Ruania halotolerans]